MDSGAPNIIVNPEKFELVLNANEDCTFELTNVGYEAVIYRVRTTAPLRYYLKHSKGVVKGNSSAKITIFLNHKTFADGLPAGARYTKDTFRVECAVLGEQDVVEAHGANLANLIQKKKDINAASVVQKYISCRVLMDGAGGKDGAAAAGDGTSRTAADKAGALGGGARASAGSDGAARGGSPAGEEAGASGRKGMTAEQMAQNTLNEKRRRNNNSAGGGQVTQRGQHTGLLRAIVAAAVVVVFAVWMVRSSGSDGAENGVAK
ncbi:MSP (Major sperm protein) domain containing protein [Novymonas esmeraldas]|uniref:MSP (Major sperm protein) domain containing protein n=1 Tax=Novymonas esmeraldas TaxID=1808958 RepID=A0AAW0EY55_9TRYP